MNVLEEFARDLWVVLGPKGCSGQKEIASRLKERHKRSFSRTQMDWMLRWVRDNEDELGWTIPPVIRGPDRPGRYLRMLCDRDSGTYIMDEESKAAMVDGGASGSAWYSHTLCRHQATALFAAGAQTASRKQREFYESLAEDFEALSKKAGRVARLIDMDGTGG